MRSSLVKWMTIASLFAGIGIGMVAMSGDFDRHLIKPAHAQPTIPTPNVYFYAAVTTAQSLIGANPSRHGLQICNSGGTNPLWILPNVATVNTGAIVNPATNVGVPVPAVASNVQSCFTVPAGLTTTVSWNGQSTTTPVTVLEYP